MRFSTLALLIALPAAAYAAVFPQQFSVGHKYKCTPPGEYCEAEGTPHCCGVTQCVWNGETSVCLSVYALPPAHWDVRFACKSTTFSVWSR